MPETDLGMAGTAGGDATTSDGGEVDGAVGAGTASDGLSGMAAV